MTKMSVIPCLLCRENLPSVSKMYEKHLKQKHMIKFYVSWIIKKTLKERGKRMAKNEDTSGEDGIMEEIKENIENTEEYSTEELKVVKGEIIEYLDSIYSTKLPLDKEQIDYKNGVKKCRSRSIDFTKKKFALKEKNISRKWKIDKNEIDVGHSENLDDLNTIYKNNPNKNDFIQARHFVVGSDEVLKEEENEVFEEKSDCVSDKDGIVIKEESPDKFMNLSDNPQLQWGHFIEGKEEENETSKDSDIEAIEKKQFKCPKCEKGFGSNMGLYHHKKTVHEQVSYTCELCDWKTAQSHRIKQHVKTVHEGVRYSCDDCNYKAKDKANLRRHVQKCKIPKPYQCPICKKGFKSKFYVETHKSAEHDGVRYNCNQCDHQAMGKNGLKFHMESVHEGIRYSCEKCEHNFTSKSNLSIHMKICSSKI